MTTGVPAHEWLAVVERNELIRILRAYGETTDAAAARRIADAICVSRTHGALPKRTKDFAALVARAKGVEYQLMHPAKLTFQVLCICVFPVVVVSACKLRFLERYHVAKGVISMAPTWTPWHTRAATCHRLYASTCHISTCHRRYAST